MQHRINGAGKIDPASVTKHVEAGKRVIAQFSGSPYSTQQLTLLNQLAAIHGRSFEIRFFGHYSEVFDASVLQLIPDAQCVSVDCLMGARNLETLCALRSLVELSLGVFELDDPGILRYCNPPSLRELSLGDTRKCNIDFSPLSGCTNLERVHSTGHTKNISTICSLPLLHDLSLASFRKKDAIDFVSEIPTLRALRLILGGRASIVQLSLPQLRSLELIRVQGLEDLGDLGRFESLENLLIEDQIRLASVQVGPNLRLVDMKIINCKTFEAISGIGKLPALSSLRVVETAIDYDRLVGALPSSLEKFAFHTGRIKRDAEIRVDLERRGFQQRATYA